MVHVVGCGGCCGLRGTSAFLGGSFGSKCAQLPATLPPDVDGNGQNRSGPQAPGLRAVPTTSGGNLSSTEVEAVVRRTPFPWALGCAHFNVNHEAVLFSTF